MSLTETINDHKRMILLYKKAEQEILEKGETEEIVLNLAKEYLSEKLLLLEFLFLVIIF